MGKSYQFVRLKGFPRGARSRRNTLGAVIAEGLREPTHIKHLLRPPSITWSRIDSPVDSPADFEAWLLDEMDGAINSRLYDGVVYERRLRRDALAVGAVIASWPQPVIAYDNQEAYDEKLFREFASDTTEWFKAFFEPYEIMIHFRLEHYDEKYPHIHLWFTPYPNAQRTVNWSLATVCSGPKKFFHNMQKRYYDEVGYKYFDEWARPYEDRTPRVDRREAIRKRESEENEAIYTLKHSEPTYRLFSATLEALDNLNSGSEPFDKMRLTPTARKVLERYQLMPSKHQVQKNNEALNKKARLYGQQDLLDEKSEPEKYSPTMLMKWNEHLLLPVFIEVIKDHQAQSQHLDTNDWLSIVIEETQLRVEASLNQMGLSDHPIASEMLSELSRSDLVSSLLQQSYKSISERAETLQSNDDGPEQRLSGPDANDSPWDQVIPR